MSHSPIQVAYCSWSDFKKEEWALAKDIIELEPTGKKLGEPLRRSLSESGDDRAASVRSRGNGEIQSRISVPADSGPLYRGTCRPDFGRVRS